ncbi:DUF4235 domain-containing protein [Nonomuraea muscovyensis]|jgi:hypothetical protein|uniref:DUF4235 domain-containing protein n=1 Tax=Nonomuraea muscovyensis TaxID=1124761 RepID=A0A7X0CAR6_9ACTN|nr:DUF4235 domain-containing protein [Nonomuraea muscovyensis]MBB6351233.1 hypothetical protein [Nonomuraea muscovyensis]MDF2710755.1 hypothetical protein [Nonomuraea muscovyensis]
MHTVEKTASLVMGMLSGALAVSLFKRVWKLTTGQDDAPDADDLGRGWTEVLVAAAIQGALFGLVKAAVHRAGAQTFRRRAVEGKG